MSQSLFLLSIGLSGHVDPFDRMVSIFCHVGCLLKIGARMGTGLNSDPYKSGDPSWASMAFCKSPPNLRVRKRKFFSAASAVRSNSNIGFEGWRHGVAIVCRKIEIRPGGQTFVLSVSLCRGVLPEWRSSEW